MTDVTDVNTSLWVREKLLYKIKGEFEIVVMLLVSQESLEFYSIKQVEFCGCVQNIAQSPDMCPPRFWRITRVSKWQPEIKAHSYG